VLKLSWTSDTRIVIHFTDAPCHGKEYHNLDDNFPKPPSDIPFEKLFIEMKSLGLDYYFMKMNDRTD